MLPAGLSVVVEADERFFCAMSGRLMTEPVQHSSGVVCDRVSLNDWFTAGASRWGAASACWQSGSYRVWVAMSITYQAVRTLNSKCAQACATSAP